jgi:hypothetical protein
MFEMQYIAFYKSDAPPHPPSAEEMAAMGKLTADQTRAGKLIASGGFLPAEQGLRIRWSRGDFSVRDGAGSATDGMGGGFGMLRADSKEELIQQVKDFLKVAGPGECTIRILMDGPAQR